MLGLTQSYQAQQLGCLANEAGMAMTHASEGDNGGGHFRAFVKVNIFFFNHPGNTPAKSYSFPFYEMI